MKNFIFNKTGFILLSVLGFILIMLIIIVPLLTWPVNEYSMTTWSFKSLRALNLADAGAESAVWEIVYNGALFSGWSGTNPKTRTFSSFTDNYGEAIGDIDVSAENTAPDHYLIISTGSVPITPASAVQKTVKVKVFPHPLFNNGLFGNNSVTITGTSLIDSYDSDEGPYTPETAKDNGDIGTNGILELLENGVVAGDAFVGPNGSIIGDIPTHLTGEDYYAGNDVEMEPVPFSDYFINLPSGGNLFFDKDTYTIPAGDYRYESVVLEGQAELVISNDTRIYIHNDFNISGQAQVLTNENIELYIGGNGNFAGNGIMNATGMPGNLIIYGVNSGMNFSFTGNNDFYGTVYAPESSIYMAGDANFYGAMVGSDVELAGNIKFHFDEDLLSSGPMVGYDISYWQED